MRVLGPRPAALGLACLGLLFAAAPAFAQGGANSSSSSSNSLGSSSPSSSGNSFGSSSSSSNSMFGSSSSFGNSNSSSGNSFIGGNSSTSGNSFIGGTSGTTSTVPGRTGNVSKPGTTSFLGGYYGNPLSMGLGSNTSVTSAGPAFGTALYTITNTQTGTARTTTSKTNTNQNNASYGSGIGVRRLPAYATTLRIKDAPPPPSAAAVWLDLQTMLVQSPQLDARDAVRVLIDGPAVVLQGQVVDDEERRLVENMVRLTPGVGEVRNELASRNPSP